MGMIKCFFEGMGGGGVKIKDFRMLGGVKSTFLVSILRFEP